MMSGIRGKNTRPEMIIRRGLHRRGFRYRLHKRDLPGVPDLVFPKFRAVIFVHGCFWHMHGCHLFKWPATRPEFWESKLLRNTELDQLHINHLLSLGWRVAVIWECSLKGKTRLTEEVVLTRLVEWLRSSTSWLEVEGEPLGRESAVSVESIDQG
jgi:DNA mismatch endonuclease (patch repair protein)